MDETMARMIDFYRTDTLVVVLPDGYALSRDERNTLEGFVFWEEGPVHVYVPESELDTADTARHPSFSDPSKVCRSRRLGDPFPAHGTGISIPGQNLRRKRGRFYRMGVEGTRIYTCHNGDRASLTYVSFLAGGAYPLYVFQGNELLLTGGLGIRGTGHETTWRRCAMRIFRDPRGAAPGPPPGPVAG
ncbi:MAG: hypothetical protein R2751_17480 [Bacteroidales bacterium]